MKRKPKPKLPPIERMLEKHPKHCTYWLFGTDRHCSCGRDAAIQDYQKLLNRLAELEAMFALTQQSFLEAQ